MIEYKWLTEYELLAIHSTIISRTKPVDSSTLQKSSGKDIRETATLSRETRREREKQLVLVFTQQHPPGQPSWH